MRGFGFLLVAWLWGSVAARADAPVILFERAPLRPSLCAALRIQLSGSAEVRCLSDGSATTLAERFDAARRRLRGEQASLGVLLEADADPDLIRMYLVSAAGEQAALTIERLEHRPEPDVDRSLALKVREAYELIGFVERELPAQQASAAAVLAKPPPSGAAPGQPTTTARPALAAAPAWYVFPELQGGLVLDSLARAQYGAQLGFGIASARRRLELAVGARGMSSYAERRAERGRIRVVEAGPLLAARFTYRFGRVELGASLQLFLAIASAESDRVRGKKYAYTPVIGVGPDLRVRLFRATYLRFAPALELSAFAQHYAINEVDVIKRDLLAASLPLSLVFVLPVAQTAEGFQP